MKKICYETGLDEVERALELADEDKRIIIENNKKIIIAVQLSKDQSRRLNKK